MATKFKALQVVRTTETVRNEKGHSVKAGSRLVVIRQDGNMVVARQPKREGHEDERALRVTIEANKLAKTRRGRPTGSTNKVVATEATAEAV